MDHICLGHVVVIEETTRIEKLASVDVGNGMR
jgi:hypothetical protein